MSKADDWFSTNAENYAVFIMSLMELNISISLIFCPSFCPVVITAFQKALNLCVLFKRCAELD